jgi:hypothetical protein
MKTETSEYIVVATYFTLTAHYDDRYYVNECVCGQEIVGRTKSDLLEAFKFHIHSCELSQSLLK